MVQARCGFAELVPADYEEKFRKPHVACGYEQPIHLVASILFHPRNYGDPIGCTAAVLAPLAFVRYP